MLNKYCGMQNSKNAFESVQSILLYKPKNEIENPFISIFIPTYKRYELFKRCLKSVLSQSFVSFDWDIVVVDNEPYNGTSNAVEEHIRSLNCDRLLYYRNKTCLDVSDNFNRGIWLAKAPWVMMVHDDDLILPNTLFRMGNSIKFLNSISKKPLGAISAFAYTFKNGQDISLIQGELVKKK